MSFEAEDLVAAQRAELRFTAEDGDVRVIDQLSARGIGADPYHHLFHDFLQRLSARPTGQVVEVGSRNRSGPMRHELVEPHAYVGVDIRAGENVDVVLDAHELSGSFEHGSVDAVFSISTFEHLAMPWKAAIEINRVLAVGGLVFVSSHQTFPMHETPWDFWRFSNSAWNALFNEATGFEVIHTALGERASIVGHLLHPVTIGLDAQPAYLGSAVLARKVADTDLEWNVPTEATVVGDYPQ